MREIHHEPLCGPDRFDVVQFEEGGERKSRGNDNLRLVCNLPAGGGKLVFWGRPTNRKNIAALELLARPFTVETRWCEPSEDHRREHGHTHWVPETESVVVVSGCRVTS